MIKQTISGTPPAPQPGTCFIIRNQWQGTNPDCQPQPGSCPNFGGKDLQGQALTWAPYIGASCTCGDRGLNIADKCNSYPGAGLPAFNQISPPGYCCHENKQKTLCAAQVGTVEAPLTNSQMTALASSFEYPDYLVQCTPGASPAPSPYPSCPANQYYNGSACVPIPTCPAGQTWFADRCVKSPSN